MMSQDPNLPSQDSILGDIVDYHKTSMYSVDSPSAKKESTLSAKQDEDNSSIKLKVPVTKPSESAKGSPKKMNNVSTIDYGSGIIAPNYVQIDLKPGFLK